MVYKQSMFLRITKIPNTGGKKLERIDGLIEFNDVAFRYPTRPEDLVKHAFVLSTPAHEFLRPTCRIPHIPT